MKLIYSVVSACEYCTYFRAFYTKDHKHICAYDNHIIKIYKIIDENCPFEDYEYEED
jgi:hypothetical protein